MAYSVYDMTPLKHYLCRQVILINSHPVISVLFQKNENLKCYKIKCDNTVVNEDVLNIPKQSIKTNSVKIMINYRRTPKTNPK